MRTLTVPNGTSVWTLANQALLKGTWLVTESALMKGDRVGTEFRFTCFQAAAGMLAKLFVAKGLEHRIGQAWQGLCLFTEHLTSQLRRESLFQIACCIRDELAAGLTGRLPNAGHLPAATILFQETMRLETSLKQRVRSAVTDSLLRLLQDEIGTGSALVLIDGAVHRTPCPRMRPVLRPLRSRPRPEPVSIAVAEIRSIGLNLHQLLSRMNAKAEELIAGWRRAAEPEVRRQLEKIERYLAENCGEADEYRGPVSDFFRDPHHRISLTADAVVVEKENTQPWHITSPTGEIYRFPGSHIQIPVTALAEIPAVKILQPQRHWFVGVGGSMCLPVSQSRIRAWQQDVSLRLGQVVAKAFRMYEDTLRIGSALMSGGGARAFEKLAPYRVRDDVELPPNALFYSNESQPVAQVRAAQMLRR